MTVTISETVNGLDKIKRYRWITKDQPGDLKNLHKSVLQIHPAYQRDVIKTKVREIAAQWSWVGAGAIVVGQRNGEFWVIDGQHRVLAAKQRSDITHLPCVVFQTDGIKQEAIAFLDLNAGRKPVSSIGKFKAMLAAGDEAAMIVHKVFNEIGVTIAATPSKGKELKSMAWAVRKAGEDAQKFEIVMTVAAELSHSIPIKEKLLDGLWYINEKVPGGILENRINDRIRAIGAARLIEAANKASAYFVRGGARIWGTGMMEEINKGLRNKFVLRGDQDE